MRLSAFWGGLASVVETGLDALVFALLRFLHIECRWSEVRSSRYHHLAGKQSGGGVAAARAKSSDADTLLKIAEEVFRQEEDRLASAKDKAKALLTLNGFLFAALSFFAQRSPLPPVLQALAFAPLVAAALLLLRDLRPRGYARVALHPRMARMGPRELRRAHAAQLLDAAAFNEGAIDFMVDTHRAAGRALLFGLAALIILVALGVRAPSGTPTQDRTRAIVDSTVASRLSHLVGSLAQPPPSPPVLDPDSAATGALPPLLFDRRPAFRHFELPPAQPSRYSAGPTERR